MKLYFTVTGMTCAACAARVEKAASKVTGVKQAEVNLLAGKLSVIADSNGVIEPVVAAIRSAGYDAFTQEKNRTVKPQTENDLSKMRYRIIFSAILLVILMYFTMGHMVGLPLPSWYHGTENSVVAALLQCFLTLPIAFLHRIYFTRGLKALWNRAPNMDSLIAVGSGVSFLYGVFALFRMAFAMGNGDWQTVLIYRQNLYFESAAMILTFITVGKFLEMRAKGKSGDAIRKLMDLTPKTATVKREGNEITIPVESVMIGDIVIVRSGDRIPVDGTIVLGRGAVDQSALTGESLPIEKSEGDVVSAATINTVGYMEIRTDKKGQDTTFAQVVRMVEEAGGSKAPIARLADKIAGVFVPVVMCIALAAFIGWLLVGQTFEFALATGISVLVISCPCALGLATPVAIMVGTGKGANIGVLFKNAEVLENLHRIDTVVLDKTGTLTEGKPQVTQILPGAMSGETLLTLAASLEKHSEHPFAKAIMLKAENLKIWEVFEFETLPGKGVSGIINQKKYFGGNRRLMEEIDVSVPSYPELEEQGQTLLYFASDEKEYLGAIAAADVLKENAKSAIAQLQKSRLSVVMLTGDNSVTARAIAAQAGIQDIVAEVLPGQKAAEVEKLRKDNRNVLMVGDGINDAPALVSANVGMAIGTGTDVAIESADVVLMNGSLEGIANAVALSRATIKNIRQNLFWAFFYNCLGIPIAAGILYPAFQIQLSPMIGAAAMSLSSVFVVTNALRLRLFRPKQTIQYCSEEHCVKNKEEIAMKTVIKVEGMMCSHCKARVENVCKAVAGTIDAVVDLEAKNVTVTGTSTKEALKKAILDAGYEVVDV